MRELYTLQQAAEILGCRVTEIMGRLSAGEIRCGVEARGWRGYPVPMSDTGKPKSGQFMKTVIAPGVRGWVATFDGRDTVIVESLVQDFWHLELGDVKEVIAAGETGAVVHWLVPADSHWHTVHPKDFPWDRFLFRLLDAPTIRVGEIRIQAADLPPLVRVDDSAKIGWRRSLETDHGFSLLHAQRGAQILVALEEAHLRENWLALPRGAGAMIKKKFEMSTNEFQSTWNMLVDAGLVRMKNHEKHARRSNKN